MLVALFAMLVSHVVTLDLRLVISVVFVDIFVVLVDMFVSHVDTLDFKISYVSCVC